MEIEIDDFPSSILVVDDIVENRDLLTRRLERQGHTVFTAENGQIALDLIKINPIDLVLLDIMMPVMNGFEVLEYLKKSPEYRHIPVVMISALDDLESIVRCIKMGAEDYIQKPFNSTLLKARVSASLEKKYLHDAETAFRKQIEEKNYQLMSSIRYAERIQQAILPPEVKIQNAFPQSFIIFQPRDVISGDFFWYDRLDNQDYIAVADCTGHGVPGSLLSMVGMILLDKIVKQNRILQPALILEHLNNEVRSTLNQEGSTSELDAMDGMDISLCKLDRVAQKLIFAGARRPLYLLRDGNLNEIKGDRKTIGGRQKDDHDYPEYEIVLQPGDTLYLFTDGFVDQSNLAGERFGSRRLKQTLTELAHLDLAEQKQDLLKILHAYQQDEAQRDDITLIGLRV